MHYTTPPYILPNAMSLADYQMEMQRREDALNNKRKRLVIALVFFMVLFGLFIYF